MLACKIDDQLVQTVVCGIDAPSRKIEETGNCASAANGIGKVAKITFVFELGFEAPAGCDFENDVFGRTEVHDLGKV